MLTLAACLLPGCMPDRSDMRGAYYTPNAPVYHRSAVAISNTPEASACGRQCQQTHEISAYNCQKPYTQYNGRLVELEVQACVDKDDNERDDCLRTCPK
jgi:hypothetical protein